MSFKITRLLSFFSVLLCVTTALAVSTAPGVSDNPQDVLAPVYSGSTSFLFTPSTGVGVGIQAGPTTYRIDTTVGTTVGASGNSRIKLSTEGLWQDIDYSFFSGTVPEWVSQFAVGAAYQYMLNQSLLNNIALSAYYSTSPSMSLPTVSVGGFTVARRIAGADSEGFTGGVNFNLWRDAMAGAALDFQNIDYHTQYIQGVDEEGIGATFSFSQQVRQFTFNLMAQLQQAYDNFQASINWSKMTRKGQLVLGLFSTYFVGGTQVLPNNLTVGVNMTFIPGAQTSQGAASALHGGGLFQPAKSLSAWLTQSAVYMPQVLAVADQQISATGGSTCVAPTLTGNIPNQSFPALLGGNFNLSVFFAGTAPLTFVMAPVPPNPPFTFNGVTGVLTSDGSVNSNQNVQVTATNACGAVTSNVFNILQN